MRVITGSARGCTLFSPKGDDVRPTAERVKEAMFSMLHFNIVGKTFLDLFGGSGQMGIEALSRGAARSVFVDQSKDSCALIRKNLEKTKLSDKAKVVLSSYDTFLFSDGEKYDIIFLDPPYSKGIVQKALRLIAKENKLADGGVIICETEEEIEGDNPEGILKKTRVSKYGRAYLTQYRKLEDQGEAQSE